MFGAVGLFIVVGRGFVALDLFASCLGCGFLCVILPELILVFLVERSFCLRNRCLVFCTFNEVLCIQIRNLAIVC